MGRTRNFRIFVSSTFSDMKAERNALQERVFPQLRALCEEHGARFQAIDLRWGVSEEATLDQQTMAICLDEIARSQRLSPRPNFIVLLGDRYGWRPLPWKIPANEYAQLEDHLRNRELHRLLQQWYRRDDNAIPAAYLLQPRTGPFVETDYWEQQVERPLRNALALAADALGYVESERLKYLASATEQEIFNGVLAAPGSAEHVLCFQRHIENAPPDARASEYLDLDEHGRLDQDACRRQQELKSRLATALPGNVLSLAARWADNGPTSSHLELLCDFIREGLSRIIRREIAAAQPSDPSVADVESHEDFARERSRRFTGRERELTWLETGIRRGGGRVLVLCGESGSGKSALLAHTCDVLNRNAPELDIIARWIGATPESVEPWRLLQSLCRQLYRTYDFDAQMKTRLRQSLGESTSLRRERREIEEDYRIPDGVPALAARFREFLAKIPADRRLVVILDALDQLSGQSPVEIASWLPETLPVNVCLVLSSVPSPYLSFLRERLPNESVCTLGPMPEIEGEQLLDRWLSDSGRTLTPAQRDEVMRGFRASGLPLYLRLAFEEARRWTSYDESPPDGSRRKLGGDVAGVWNDLFTRLSSESHHGSVLVAHGLGYLACAKEGLSEDELLDVLSRDTEVMAEFRRRSRQASSSERLPVVVWSRLLGELAPYLTLRNADGAVVLNFFHRQLTAQVEALCLGGEEKLARHRALARYFVVQPTLAPDASGRPSLRKLTELPYQLAFGRMDKELVALFTDPAYLRARLDSAGIQTLLSDFDSVLVHSTRCASPPLRGAEKGLRLIQEALRQSAHVLAQDSAQLASQLQGRLRGIDTRETQAVLEIIDSRTREPWFYSLAPGLEPPGGPLLRRFVGHDHEVQALCVSPDGQTLVTISSWKTILWDIATGTIRSSFPVHDCCAVAIAPNGRQFLTGGHRGFDSWELPSGAPLGSLECHGSIRALTFTPDGRQVIALIHGSEVLGIESRIQIVDLQNGRSGARFPVNCDLLAKRNRIALLPDGRRLLVACNDSIQLWDVESQTELTSFSNPVAGDLTFSSRESICSLIASPDGRVAFSGSSRGQIVAWDIETARPAQVIAELPGEIDCLAVTPDGKKLVAATFESLFVCDLAIGQVYGPLRGHSEWVTDLAVTSDSRFFFSSSLDKTICLFDLERLGVAFETSALHQPDTRALEIVRNRRVALSISPTEIKTWDLTGFTLMNKRQLTSESLSVVTVSPNGDRLMAQLDETSDITILDLASGQEIRRLEDADLILSSLLVSYDGRRLLGGAEKGVAIWDLDNGRLVFRDEYLRAPCVLTPDGLCFLTADFLGGLYVTALADGARYAFIESRFLGSVTGLAITPDGRFAVIARKNVTDPKSKLTLWDLALGANGVQPIGEWGEISALTMLPDGRRMLIAGADDPLSVFDLIERKVVARFHGDHGIVRCAITPDGSVVLGQDQVGTIYCLSLRGLNPDPPIVTVWHPRKRFWRLWRLKRDSIAGARCPWCEHWWEPPVAALGAVVACPSCDRPIRLNAFTLEADHRAV